jgi:hypothetical protein
MIIYQVVYYNQFSEKVAEFGFYEDKFDAEKRAFEVRFKTPSNSGRVEIEEVFVHDSTHKEEEVKAEEEKEEESKEYLHIYDLKPHD